MSINPSLLKSSNPTPPPLYRYSKVIMLKAGDSLTKFAKLIPLSLFGTGLNNVVRGFCAKAENEIKKNICRFSKPFLIIKDTIKYDNPKRTDEDCSSQFKIYSLSHKKLLVKLFTNYLVCLKKSVNDDSFVKNR